MRAFRGGAYANALSKRSAQRRGKAGGLSLAEKADLRWRNSAKEILPRLQANHPDWGRTRLTAALLESPGFIEMEDQPSEGSVGRLIETMRKKGQLPARKDDSGEEP